MKVFRLSCLFVLLFSSSLVSVSQSYEVRKEYLFGSWWDRLLLKILENDQVSLLKAFPKKKSQLLQ
jgi:hypothetical protein